MDDVTCAENAELVADRLDERAVIIDPAADVVPTGAEMLLVAPVAAVVGDGLSCRPSRSRRAQDVSAALSRPVVVIAAMNAADGLAVTASTSQVVARPLACGTSARTSLAEIGAIG